MDLNAEEPLSSDKKVGQFLELWMYTEFDGNLTHIFETANKILMSSEQRVLVINMHGTVVRNWGSHQCLLLHLVSIVIIN